MCVCVCVRVPFFPAEDLGQDWVKLDPLVGPYLLPVGTAWLGDLHNIVHYTTLRYTTYSLSFLWLSDSGRAEGGVFAMAVKVHSMLIKEDEPTC